MTSRLKERYKEEIVPAMMEKFGYDSIMEVAKIDKIVLNMGLGNTSDNPKALEGAIHDLTMISGQKPITIRAKKSIANFKLREGTVVGAKVTLRGERMYDFLDKLVSISLPRVRDFRGISPKSFDGRGNYSLGIKEQIIFPEIVYDEIDSVRGLDISIITTAKSDEEAKALLDLVGMPFKK